MHLTPHRNETAFLWEQADIFQVYKQSSVREINGLSCATFHFITVRLRVQEWLWLCDVFLPWKQFTCHTEKP